MKSADVVIIGGGCMGASVAYFLCRLGVTNVLLVEREDALGAGSTGRNAGGVRHQFSHEANVRLSLESIAFFERFEEEVGSPADFHQDGYLFLLSRESSVEAFRRSRAMQATLGVEVEWLDAGGAQVLAPGITTEGILAATFCARDGIADPGGVTVGFASAARRAGATIWQGVEVTGVVTDGQGVCAVETTRGTVLTRRVVNAAGPWVSLVGRMAGVEIPVEPLRRHIFVAEPPSPGGWMEGGTPTAPASRIMVIDFDTTFYFHREGTGILFGMGDPEERPGFDSEVNLDVLERVAPVAAARLPALSDAPLAHAWAGLYEMTPDAMPILGATGPDGLFTIGGFSGHGFQHAPAAGRILADLVTGRDPALDLTPFAFERLLRGRPEGEVNVV